MSRDDVPQRVRDLVASGALSAAEAKRVGPQPEPQALIALDRLRTQANIGQIAPADYRLEKERLIEIARGEKECPDCAEAIKLKARVCPFCGYRFGPGPLPA